VNHSMSHNTGPASTQLLANGSREPTAAEAAVLQAMHALSQACLDAHRDDLAGLTMASLTYSHTDGRIQTREAFIDALVNGQSVFHGIELRNVAVQLAGEIALVGHRALYDTFNRGEPGTSDVQINQVWLFDAGAWRLRLRQARKTPNH
jgi:hypothetical protein